jgi:hypothetical protein
MQAEPLNKASLISADVSPALSKTNPLLLINQDNSNDLDELKQKFQIRLRFCQPI